MLCLYSVRCCIITTIYPIHPSDKQKTTPVAKYVVVFMLNINSRANKVVGDKKTNKFEMKSYMPKFIFPTLLHLGFDGDNASIHTSWKDTQYTPTFTYLHLRLWRCFLR